MYSCAGSVRGIKFLFMVIAQVEFLLPLNFTKLFQLEKNCNNLLLDQGNSSCFSIILSMMFLPSFSLIVSGHIPVGIIC